MCIQMISKVSLTESETYKKALSHNFLLSDTSNRYHKHLLYIKTIKEAPSEEGEIIFSYYLVEKDK